MDARCVHHKLWVLCHVLAEPKCWPHTVVGTWLVVMVSTTTTINTGIEPLAACRSLLKRGSNFHTEEAGTEKPRNAKT